MKKWHLFILVLCGLVTAAICFRSPRTEPGMFLVTESKTDRDQMTVDCRMSQPFEVSLHHGARKPLNWPKDPGIHFGGWTQLRTDKTEFVASEYDLLRGEYYVRLHLQRGRSVAIDGNGRHFEIAPWFEPDAQNIRWIPSQPGVQYGDGVGIDLVLFDTSKEREEYLMLYAGSHLEHAGQ